MSSANAAAFEAFYRRHVTLVSRFLARRVIDPQLVADLTAEVFHEVIRSDFLNRAAAAARARNAPLPGLTRSPTLSSSSSHQDHTAVSGNVWSHGTRRR